MILNQCLLTSSKNQTQRPLRDQLLSNEIDLAFFVQRKAEELLPEKKQKERAMIEKEGFKAAVAKISSPLDPLKKQNSGLSVEFAGYSDSMAPAYIEYIALIPQIN